MENDWQKSNFNDALEGLFDEAMSAELDPGNIDEENLCSYSPLLKELSEEDCRYSIIDKVGNGGMKDIYRVYDNHSRREVAMAVMKKIVTIESAEDFVKEARLTACLQHPNIMPVHDVGISVEGIPFFTMKLIQGLDLSQAFTNTPPFTKGGAERDALLDIFLRVCDAVSFAHQQEVIHLDLKPSNIQVGLFGQVLVCDWGLAKLANTSSSPVYDSLKDELSQQANTLYGSVKGTLGYMSPEQAKGVASEKTTASDIYSLGAILYFILTGKPPLNGSAQEIIDKTIKGDWLKPSERFPQKNIPASLEAVILRAMALEPRDRYLSVEELKTDVQSFIRGYATRAEQAGFAKQALLLYQRNRTYSAIIFSFIILAISGASYFFFQLNRENNRTAEALAMLKAESQKRILISQNAAPEFYRKASDAYSTFNTEQAEENLKITLALNPDQKPATQKLAVINLAKLDFAKAMPLLETCGEHNLKEICSKFSKKYPTVKEKQNHLFLLIQTLEKAQYGLVSQHIITEQNRTNTNFEQQITTVLKYLRLLNPHINSKGFVCDYEKKSLSLTNRVLIKNISPLRALPLKRLSLSGTQVIDLKPLQLSKELIELNLSNSTAYNIEPLKDLPLEKIDLYMTNIYDLAPLKTTPLIEMAIPRSNRINTLSTIKAIKTIEAIYLTKPNNKNWLKLSKERPNIKIIPYKKDNNFYR